MTTSRKRLDESEHDVGCGTTRARAHNVPKQPLL